MNDERKIDPSHESIRGVLRMVGPLLVGIGLALMAVGIGSFFASFGQFGPPRFFWCAFLGMPILFAGGVCCQFGYLGKVSRYVAGETAPVQKDTFNYLAQGTQQGVRTLASAVRKGFSASDTPTAVCSKCGASNEADARFCAQCGEELPRQRICAKCNAVNVAGSRYCNQCGSDLTD